MKGWRGIGCALEIVDDTYCTCLGGAMSESDTQYWLQRLRSVRGLQDCEFPSGLELLGRSTAIEMHLCPDAASDNMQEDRAAFEAWCLALNEHCGVDQIQLRVSPDAPMLGTHANRFRYRLKCFRELFAGFVTIDPQCGWLAEPITDDPELRINKSYRRKAAPLTDPWLAMQDARNDSEAQLEFGLEVSRAFRKAFNLKTVMRQWPVGVFRGAVKREQELLPRHKSAIDLIGIGDVDAPLFLFELKKAGNRKAGIIGELLFYTSVMREVLRGSIKYEDERAARNCTLAPSDLLPRHQIESVFITIGRHHPLVEQGGIIDALNRAATKAWPQQAETARPKAHLKEVSASFSVAKIKSLPTKAEEDFDIER
jgi:hypothetical protein